MQNFSFAGVWSLASLFDLCVCVPQKTISEPWNSTVCFHKSYTSNENKNKAQWTWIFHFGKHVFQVRGHRNLTISESHTATIKTRCSRQRQRLPIHTLLSLQLCGWWSGSWPALGSPKCTVQQCHLAMRWWTHMSAENFITGCMPTKNHVYHCYTAKDVGY